MIDRRRLIGLAAASALSPGIIARPALAQAAPWPRRVVRLVAPFPPGGGTDAVARIMANRLSEIWGQQMVIENKGGAGSNIGTDMVARSEPDGYTILIGSLPMAVNRHIYSSLPYDPIADFAPVSQLCIYPNLMVVPNSSPAKTVLEFVDYAKANSGKITFASSGTGTSPHLSGELFKRVTGIEMTHVPYRGVAPALNDVIPGRVDVMFNTMAGVLQQARAGQVRGLAVTTAERFPTAPEFPTVAEAGVPGFEVTSWYAFFVPAKTPAEIVKKLHADTVAVLAEPAIKERLAQVGVLVVGSTPDELAARLKSETEMWGPVIKAAGIKADG
ncbi:MAG TPA: tripartite tricarboxylate transporter substrate binding protein [Xanthobacteraceae bacterium]|nr:tripartite tricarboxylate transporter substrate binding protein [Xanthobacteraceae bacterium]